MTTPPTAWVGATPATTAATNPTAGIASRPGHPPAFLLFGRPEPGESCRVDVDHATRPLLVLSGDRRFGEIAMQSTHAPGQLAPISATYEQTNVFGSPTGIRVHVTRGRPLPGAPIGHEWIVVVEHPEDC
jgi:hypothetical protein